MTQVYEVIVGRLNVRDAATIKGKVKITVSKGDTLTVDEGIVVVEDGYIWRRIAGANLWVAEAQALINSLPYLRRVEPNTGRVTTDANGFQLDGKPFRFVGANIREFAYYGTNVLPYSYHENKDMELKAMKNCSMRVLRFFAPHHLVSIETSIRLVHEALDLLFRHNMLGIVVLSDALGNSGYYPPGDGKFHTEVLGHVNAQSYFHERGYHKFYLPFVKRIVKAMADHPAIFAWEIGNEFAIHPQPASTADSSVFKSFLEHVAAVIRENDPNHLITTGLVNSGHGVAHNGNRYTYAQEIINIGNIDFATVHFYHDSEKVPAEFSNSIPDMILSFASGKPFIVEEYGVSNLLPLRANHLRDTIKQCFDSYHASGFMQWGFSATGRDIGSGDNRYGMDNYAAGNRYTYNDFASIYQEWGQRFANEETD